MNREKREQKLAAALRAIIIILIIVVLATVTFFSFSYYLDLHNARTALYQAKTTRLAAWSISIQCYGASGSFSDMSSEDGFADGVSEKIKELSLCEGEPRLVRTKDNGYGIAEMTYSDGDYTVVYKSDGDADSWQVYKKSVLITS